MKLHRALGLSLAASLAIAASVTPVTAMANNSTSLGGGVKCTWVVVNVVGNTTYLQRVCRKGV